MHPSLLSYKRELQNGESRNLPFISAVTGKKCARSRSFSLYGFGSTMHFLKFLTSAFGHNSKSSSPS